MAQVLLLLLSLVIDRSPGRIFLTGWPGNTSWFSQISKLGTTRMTVGSPIIPPKSIARYRCVCLITETRVETYKEIDDRNDSEELSVTKL